MAKKIIKPVDTKVITFFVYIKIIPFCVVIINILETPVPRAEKSCNSFTIETLDRVYTGNTMKIQQNISIFSKGYIYILATLIILINPTLRGNTPPTELKLSPGFILENQPKNSEIGTLSITDPDPNDTHTYKIIGGSDDYAFKVSGDKLLAKYTLDYEGTNALKVLIRSTDSSGATLEQELVVHVGNVQEAPDGILPDKTHIEENIPPGTEVATIAVLDPDNLTGWGYTDLPQDDAGSELGVQNGRNSSISPCARK